jgi:threonine/homoserine/homoserine lactone efflux protein
LAFILPAHGVGDGRRSAVAAAAGMQTGSAIRVLLTAAGLSAALASSALAFEVVRWAGLAYPLYLGVHAIRSAPARDHPQRSRRPAPLATSLDYRGGLDLVFACASGSIGSWMTRRPRVCAAQPRVEAVAYLGLAGWAAVSGFRLAHCCGSRRVLIRPVVLADRSDSGDPVQGEGL